MIHMIFIDECFSSCDCEFDRLGLNREQGSRSYLLAPSIATSNRALYIWMDWGVNVTSANMCDWLGTFSDVVANSKTSMLRDACRTGVQIPSVSIPLDGLWSEKRQNHDVLPWR